MGSLRRGFGLVMIWGIMALVVIIWVGRKFRPAHLGDDILKWEIFRHLRFRNAADAAAHMSYEDLEKRLWLQTGAGTTFVFACFTLSVKALGLTLTASSMISSVLSLICLIGFLRKSRTYRQITLPLFATLCRIPQSRWDMRARPWNWVKVNQKHGKLYIRLPKDWHATKLHLKSIQELVNARVTGHWTMSANTSAFLLTFTRESAPETVVVTGNEKPTFPEDWEITEKETDDNGPF